MCAPATPQILDEFHSTSHLESTILVSIWELGEVVGPLIVGPLSERYGRLPVYHTANFLFVIFSAAAAQSTSIQMLIAFRFLLGVSVASTTLNPCIVGDLFDQQHRGRALAIMGMTPFIAPVLGPTIGGFISEAKGWRWTFWLTTIFTGVLELGFLAVYRESYKVVILERKAHRLRKDTRNERLQSRYDTGVSGNILLGQAVLRPLQLIFLSPVMLLLSTSGAFAISYTYVIITSLGGIFEQNYGFSEGSVGLSYLGLGTCLSSLHTLISFCTKSLCHIHIYHCPPHSTDPISGFGMIASVIICGAFLDARFKKASALGPPKPEHRLPPVILGSVLVPVGLTAFGWAAQAQLHWIVPILCTAVVGFGFVAVSLASWSYLVDAFGIYAASATAATTVLRNVAAATLPLAAPPLYSRLGLGWGNTVLGFVALAFTPVPVLLMRLGERMRGTKGLLVPM